MTRSGSTMNHTYIEEHQIADRYVMGSLPPEEAEIFEDHYLSCQQCLDRLALAESMQRGFKRAAGQDAARLTAARQLAFVAWLARLSRSRQAAALLLGLLVVAVVAIPGALAWRRLGDVDRELAETRRALDQEREKSRAGGSRNAAEVEKLRSEIAANQRELAQEREARKQANQQLAQALEPEVNVPFVILEVVRSGGSGEAPLYRVPRPPGGGSVLLAPQLDPPFAPSYRAILHNSAGKEIWRRGGLQPNEMDLLSLSFPGSMLELGDYTLTVAGEGAPAASRSRFTFRVVP